MSPAAKAHLGRVLRLTAFTVASSGLFVNTVNSWAARYPLIGLGVGLLEALYRTAVPTVPAPGPGDVLAPPARSDAGGSSSP